MCCGLVVMCTVEIETYVITIKFYHLWNVILVNNIAANFQELAVGDSSVFQLGIFLRALHPAHTALRPARSHSALPEFKKKKKLFEVFFFTKCNCCFCVFRHGCKNACRFVPMFSSIAHKIVSRPRFVHALDCDRILVIRALNCAWLCIIRALNLCPKFGCSRARLCPISFAPCPFPNLAGTLFSVHV